MSSSTKLGDAEGLTCVAEEEGAAAAVGGQVATGSGELVSVPALDEGIDVASSVGLGDLEADSRGVLSSIEGADVGIGWGTETGEAVPPVLFFDGALVGPLVEGTVSTMVGATEVDCSMLGDDDSTAVGIQVSAGIAEGRLEGTDVVALAVGATDGAPE
jgi:hypothetical protein